MSVKAPSANVAASRTRYGSVLGQPTLDRNLRFGKAIKVIVAADGKVSDAEMDAFLDMAALFGLSDGQMSEFVEFDPKSTKLEDCLKGFGDDAFARRMIYDAIKISSADGYAAEEREAVRKAAQIMGVDLAHVATLEGIVETEIAIGKMRTSLLASRG
jgi:tellurite resistance protein